MEAAPGEFHVVFPVWAVVDPAAGCVAVRGPAGMFCLALFTDEDLARRFAREGGLGAGIGGVDSAKGLARLIDSQPPQVTHVAFDPPARAGAVARWVLPRGEVLRQVRGREGPAGL